jgi:glycerol-3-phosphate acyltransferase PlsY
LVEPSLRLPVIAGAAILLGYLLGAIPIGLLVGRWMRGVDIRQYGSRRIGATNVLRTLGTGAAAIVFIADLAKGGLAVLVARSLLIELPEPREWIAAAAGVAAVIGHTRSAFIGFAGGRGVATSLGALIALLPLAALVVAPLVAVIMWRWRFVSLGSIAGAAAVPLIVAALMALRLGGAMAAHLAYAAAAGGLVIAAHADNIARLRAGTERKIGERERIDA